MVWTPFLFMYLCHKRYTLKKAQGRQWQNHTSFQTLLQTHPHIHIMEIHPIAGKLHCTQWLFWNYVLSSAHYFFIATSSNTAAFILCYVLGSCISSVLISLTSQIICENICWFVHRHFQFYRKIPNILFRNE